jgi:ribonuclease HI
MKMKKSKNWTVIYFDGAAEPSNPGPASGAAVIDLLTGESLIVTIDLGVQTNNVAEYSGAIIGLKKAVELDCKRVKLFGDSQLVIYQLSGRYAVKNAALKLLHQQALKLLKQFEEYSLCWIPRAKNSRADAAAGSVLKSKYPHYEEIPDGLPVPKPRKGLETEIQELRLKGEKTGFKEWLNLKSGRDEFSLLKGEALLLRIPPEVRSAVEKALRPGEDSNEKFLATVYRWYLRGLPAKLALVKCRVDAEVSANAQASPKKNNDFHFPNTANVQPALIAPHPFFPTHSLPAVSAAPAL